MDKQERKPNLFDQALVIAINEGKAESSKDADPSQSGVVGENYLLFSKQRKLLISIPLENLKRNTSKVSNAGKVSTTGKRSNGWMYFGWFVFGYAFLAFLNYLVTPDMDISKKARSSAAANSLATMAKECAVKIADMGSGTVIVPKLQGYKPKKNNIAGFYLGNNRKLSGTSIVCPTTGEITFASEDESKYPTFSYNVGTGKKTCIADSGSIAEKMSCKNGEW